MTNQPQTTTCAGCARPTYVMWAIRGSEGKLYCTACMDPVDVDQGRRGEWGEQTWDGACAYGSYDKNQRSERRAR